MTLGTHQETLVARHESAALIAWLDWYRLAGVDCALHEVPASALDAGADIFSATDRHDLGAQATTSTGAAHVVPPRGPADPALQSATTLPGGGPPKERPDGNVRSARQIAAGASSLEELRAALECFEGCALRRTATRLCFADGNPNARVMLIGEAPGAEEDRQGKPFVGPSGKLLDRMLVTIGLDRRSCWITNMLFWRPPGNRAPTTAEMAVCQPFLERQIDLVDPALLVFVGGIAARALLGRSEGVTKLRGRRLVYVRPSDGAEIPALVTFHPAYLLRQPLQKKLVWQDLLTLAELMEQSAAPSVH